MLSKLFIPGNFLYKCNFQLIQEYDAQGNGTICRRNCVNKYAEDRKCRLYIC